MCLLALCKHFLRSGKRRKGFLDCINSTLVQFRNGDGCDGSKISATVHTIPARFDNDRKFDGDKPVAIFLRIWCQRMFLNCRKMFLFHLFRLFTRFHFQVVPVRVRFSKSTVF